MNIGYVILDGFSNADLVGTQAVLGISKIKFHYVSDDIRPVKGDNKYAINSTTTFKTCPNLDILIVPNHEGNDLSKEALDFIRKQDKLSKYTVGLSRGVLYLGQAGILRGRAATSNKETMALFEKYDIVPVNKGTFMRDGKYLSAGPSTGAIELAYYLSYIIRGKAITKMLELNLEYNPTRAFDDYKPVRPENLKPLKVAVTCPPNLYLPDVAGAVDVFAKLGSEIYFVWKDKSEKSSILGPSVYSNMTFDECPQVDVLITGAITPSATVDQELMAFYKKQAKEARAVVGVCAGVFVLGAAGMLEGRMAVTNLHMLSMLKAVGAKRHNTETTVDGKSYTAGPAIGSYEIAIQVVGQLYGPETAAYVEREILEYQPKPLFDMGTPRKAGHMRHALSLLVSAPLRLLYKGKVKRRYKSNSK